MIMNDSNVGKQYDTLIVQTLGQYIPVRGFLWGYGPEEVFQQGALDLRNKESLTSSHVKLLFHITHDSQWGVSIIDNNGLETWVIKLSKQNQLEPMKLNISQWDLSNP